MKLIKLTFYCIAHSIKNITEPYTTNKKRLFQFGRKLVFGQAYSPLKGAFLDYGMNVA